MPIMDAELLFCEELDIAGVATSHKHGTNIVYLPQVKNFKGDAIDDSPNNSGQLYWNVVVEGADLLAGTDGSVITLALYNGDTGTNPLIDNSGVVILTKDITENTPTEHPDGTLLLSIPLPAGQLHPYFDIYVYVATQTLSTGKITSWIGGKPQLGE
jgi:hypothetical protein